MNQLIVRTVPLGFTLETTIFRYKVRSRAITFATVTKQDTDNSTSCCFPFLFFST